MKNKRLILNRLDSIGNSLPGILYDPEGEFVLHTIENLEFFIPCGFYAMLPDEVGKHRSYTLLGEDIAPHGEWKQENCRYNRLRTNIEFHVGNVASESKGCILVGDRFGYLNGEFAVFTSAPAIEKLNEYLGRETTHALIIR